MENLLNDIAREEQDLQDVVAEVGRVLNEMVNKSKEHSYYEDIPMKWEEVGRDQIFVWKIKFRIYEIQFTITEIINNIRPQMDREGYPIVTDKIDISQVEDIVKDLIYNKIKH